MEKNDCGLTKYISLNTVVMRHIGEVYLLVPYKKITQVGCDQFFATNYVGAAIWETCGKASSIKEIVDILKGKFVVSESELREDIVQIVQLLVNYGFLLEEK